MRLSVSRRGWMAGAGALAGLLVGDRKAAARSATQELERLRPPTGKVPIAIVVDDYANLMDTASVWEPFLSAGLPTRPPFKPEHQLFSVAVVGPAIKPYHTNGNMPGPNGFIFTPHYTFEDAPQPKIVIIPSQMNGSEVKKEWIRKAAAEADVVMGVCLGSSLLASTGLLDGLTATSHHAFIDDFAAAYPKVKWVRGRRFIDHGKFVTAGGYTSGIDAALHIIARYHGPAIAAATAEWIEHDGDGWKTGIRAGA